MMSDTFTFNSSIDYHFVSILSRSWECDEVWIRVCRIFENDDDDNCAVTVQRPHTFALFVLRVFVCHHCHGFPPDDTNNYDQKTAIW